MLVSVACMSSFTTGRPELDANCALSAAFAAQVAAARPSCLDDDDVFADSLTQLAGQPHAEVFDAEAQLLDHAFSKLRPAQNEQCHFQVFVPAGDAEANLRAFYNEFVAPSLGTQVVSQNDAKPVAWCHPGMTTIQRALREAFAPPGRLPQAAAKSAPGHRALVLRALLDAQDEGVARILEAAQCGSAEFFFMSRRLDSTPMYSGLGSGESQVMHRWLCDALDREKYLTEAEKHSIAQSLSARPRFGTMSVCVQQTHIRSGGRQTCPGEHALVITSPLAQQRKTASNTAAVLAKGQPQLDIDFLIRRVAPFVLVLFLHYCADKGTDMERVSLEYKAKAASSPNTVIFWPYCFGHPLGSILEEMLKACNTSSPVLSVQASNASRLCH